MKSDLTRSHTPLRQLLYVEWVLLGMAVLMTLPSFVFYPGQKIVWAWVGMIAGLAVMGLHLPRRRPYKIGYTAAELGLLLSLAALSSSQASSALLPLLPLLGLVVVIRSCQIFQVWGRVAVVAVVFLLHGTVVFAFGDVPLPQMVVEHLGTAPARWQVNAFKTNLIVFFGLVLVFVLLLVDALLSVYHSQQDLAVAHEQLRNYAARIESQATLQERNRIAREIHDSLGHALTAQTILLENALLFLPPAADRARDYLRTATQSAYQALREVSQSVSTLRTGALQEVPLSKAIPVLVKEICQSAHIVPDYLIELPEPLAEDLSLALFRIVQEALTNTVKHSQAILVQVRLVAKADRLHLQVRDNGKGFDPSKNTTGFGLRGMRERAAALGGTCQIWSAPGAGCRISVVLPLPAAPIAPVAPTALNDYPN